MWEPARIVELVRVHGCLPALGGARLDLFFLDRCNVDHLTDFDLLYLSELDPT